MGKLAETGLTAHAPPYPVKSDEDVAAVLEQVFSIAQLAALLAVSQHLFKFRVRVASFQQVCSCACELFVEQQSAKAQA